MNLFMPYDRCVDSVEALDDRRLIKQILECKVLLDVSLGKSVGYSKHPVAVYYREYPSFICWYALMACTEYAIRFDREHSLHRYFGESFSVLQHMHRTPEFPLYAEGSKNSKNCIRVASLDSFDLFKQKLAQKWNTDKYPPKWTNRGKPIFYKEKET